MASTSRRFALLVSLVVAGCGAPLMDPLPPEEDAANPEAPIPAYAETPNALTTSAFEGAKVEGGGHEHHGHHGNEGHKKQLDHAQHQGHADKEDAK